jgi:hypothetical protein
MRRTALTAPKVDADEQIAADPACWAFHGARVAASIDARDVAFVAGLIAGGQNGGRQ